MSEKTYIQIPIDGETGILQYYTTPMVWPSPGIFGGGSSNNAEPAWESWPESCGALACEAGAGTWSSWSVGEAYGPPGNTIWVEDKDGNDKTDEVLGTSLAVNTDRDGVGSSTVIQMISYTNVYTQVPHWSPGDIVHIPAGIDATNSWNTAFGADASLAMDIVIQPEWILYEDAPPLIINIDSIICVEPSTVNEVRIGVSNVPGSTTANEAEYRIQLKDNGGSGPVTAMDAVTCINKTLAEAVRNPGSNPVVNWNFAGASVSAGGFQFNIDGT